MNLENYEIEMRQVEYIFFMVDSKGYRYSTNNHNILIMSDNNILYIRWNLTFKENYVFNYNGPYPLLYVSYS